MSSDPYVLDSLEALDALYGEPSSASLIKELPAISPDYARFIETAPFALLASNGPKGIDVSPRGDPAPLARVDDPNTLLIPDRRGNNRLDTLRNLVRDPRIGVLFLIPGVGETIRVIGRAALTVDPALLARFEHRAKPPATVMRITVERVFFQCQKAVVRSGLWRAESQIARSDLPSTGAMLQAMSSDDFDGAAYDAEYPERMQRTMY
ncbi:MAG: pyridoxamine 5'-phosphate oxidase family protein [Pseudomonadota bacterium]